MNTSEILTELKRRNISWKKGLDPKTSFSSHLIRCDDLNGAPAYFIGGEVTPEKRITSVIDALYLEAAYQNEEQSGSFQLMYGKGEEHKFVLQALSNLRNDLDTKLPFTLLTDFEPAHDINACDFSQKPKNWHTDYLKRLIAGQTPVPVLAQINTLVDSPLLTWAPSSSDAQVWAGRIDGVQVCTIDDTGSGQLHVSAEPRAERIVIDLLEEHSHLKNGQSFDSNQFEDLKKSLQLIIDSRRSGRLQECSLHDRVRFRVHRGKSKLGSFQVVCSDFPVKWSADDQEERFTDLIMRDQDTPILVQIEVSTGGRIQDSFRHAVVKAALGRNFIRKASFLHPWFETQGMNPEKCKAVVSFPKLTSARARSRFANLEAIAALFDVAILPIRGSIA